MRTQVGIVGGGPAGLLLSHLLHLQGVDSVVLEHRDREHVEHRVRAGVLEQGTADTLREAGLGKRLDADGLRHEGIELRFEHARHRIDFADLVGRAITVYGQQKVVGDLVDARLADGGDVRFDVDDVALHDLDTPQPRITFTDRGTAHVLECDFVAGCDGSHGVSRSHLPTGATLYEHTYPFAWLGILADAPPSSAELIYARHEHGFALHSMRSPSLTRLYLQVRPDEQLAAWPDERIWDELHTRLATDGFTLTEGTILDRSITPMRSFVVEPMQHGRLYLAGDAAHTVPPTGAKGLNLAVADVRLLARALAGHYADGRDDLLAGYTESALGRVWRATHFSWWMTSMLHRAPDEDAFAQRLALAQLRYVASSRSMAASLAENYTGLPFTQGWSYR